MIKPRATKHIKLTPENYNSIKQRGQFGETFNDVITKMLRGSHLD